MLSDRIVVEITQEPGQSLPRPDDRARRGRRAAQDAQRDRARHPARRPDADLPRRRRGAAPVRASLGHDDLGHHADRAARRAHPDDDRRAALARSASPAWTASCAATCSRSPAARSRPPATSTCCCSTRPARSRSATARRRSSSRCPASPRPSWPRPRRCPRWPTRRRRAARSSCSPSSTASASTSSRRTSARFVPFTAQTRMSGVDYDGTRLRKGAGRRGHRASSTSEGGQAPPELQPVARPHRPRGRHAAGGRARQPGARRHLPQGHRQGGHAPPLRPAARDGHPHGHGHRRQPADRGQDRRGGRRRRLPRRGHAGGASSR